MYQTMSTEPARMSGALPPSNIRALLLDDSNFDRARIRRLSRKADMVIELDEVGSIEELDIAVTRLKYDLILIDYRLPVGDGMLALEHVLENPKNKDSGKIMITGDTAVDIAVQAMRGGCHDFLTKEGMTAAKLNHAIVNAMYLAEQHQFQNVQTDHQQAIILKELAAAFADSELQRNVVMMMRQQLMITLRNNPHFTGIMDPSDVGMLLAGFSEDDEFRFHSHGPIQ